jgi:cyclopropane fatty-acyl-phospholipid synthase-like methyltransferase
VLEIGCGIGSLTSLLIKKINHGTYEALDASRKSIDFAKKHLCNSTLVFTACDVMEYTPIHQPFDFILMIDVLEHIPKENYRLLLSKISGWMHDQSVLVIHIPNPEYILYDQANQPGVLQEIDQPVYVDELLPICKNTFLDLVHFETNSIWVKNDYQFLVFKKHSSFKEIKIAGTRTFFEKAINWLHRKWKKYRHPYPL